MVDMFIVHTMEEIQGLIDAHNQFKATLGEADKEYNSIVSLVHEVESTVETNRIPGGLANPYTTLTANVILYVLFCDYYFIIYKYCSFFFSFINKYTYLIKILRCIEYIILFF